MPLTLVDHALVRTMLTGLRDKTTPPSVFRRLAHGVSTILAVEASRGLATNTRPVETPLETTEGYDPAISLVAVPILRAGLGMLEAVLTLLPETQVGYLGLERDESTAQAGLYYRKLPDLAGKTVWMLDPMLATGGSASRSASILYAAGADRINMLAIVSAPEGVDLLTREHPGIHVITASLDRELNDRKYILPGLGDFGDRLFGTN